MSDEIQVPESNSDGMKKSKSEKLAMRGLTPRGADSKRAGKPPYMLTYNQPIDVIYKPVTGKTLRVPGRVLEDIEEGADPKERLVSTLISIPNDYFPSRSGMQKKEHGYSILPAIPAGEYQHMFCTRLENIKPRSSTRSLGRTVSRGLMGVIKFVPNTFAAVAGSFSKKD